MNKTLASLLRTALLLSALAASLPASAATPGSAARAPAASTVDTCSWDRPGKDPFMGDVVAAVDRYQDIPVDVRQRLKARMVKRDYDDVVSIRRDSIAGRARTRYGSTIRDMHFGNSKVCRSVSRAAWTAQMQERGLVYCDSGQCILVPTVCRNVSRIARAEVANERADAAPVAEAPPVATLDLLPAPIPFDVSPEALALPGAGTPADDYRYGGGVGPGGGAHGSLGAGSAGAAIPGIATITGQAGGFENVSAPSVAVTPVPEPETWALMLGGIAALAAWRRRQARR